MPLPFCLAAMLVGAVLTRTKYARLGRTLLIGGLVLLMLLSNSYVSRRLIRPLETRYAAIPELVAGAPVPADLAACRFVVVLGAGNGYAPDVSASNLLSSSAVARITEGVRLLRVLPGAKLIVSGPGTGAREPHATVLARAAQSLGIAADRILHVDHARDTEEEAQAVQRLVGGAHVALVTSACHMPRAVALFRHAGIEPLPCPTDYTAHALDPFYFDDLFWKVSALERSTLAVRERIGYLWIWLRGKT